MQKYRDIDSQCFILLSLSLDSTTNEKMISNRRKHDLQSFIKPAREAVRQRAW